MNKVHNYLTQASAAYYAGAPIISDEQFDHLADVSGYNQVGAAETGVKARHTWPMYSLQKHYEDSGVAKPLAGISDVSASVKLDGAAVSLLYVGGELVQVLTRGDGIEGQVITSKFLASRLVPHTLPANMFPGVVQITGEIVAPINIPNSRNYAAGALNLKSDAEFCERALTFIAYGVFPYITDKHNSDMRVLQQSGFGTCKESDLEKIFPSDGLVFRANSNKLFTELGYTAKHPRGAYALKQRAEHVETTLLAVEWQVGKSGKVTPVAILEPVMIGDALVSRATLNNPGFIEMLGIEIGDVVAVARAGAIIPCILHKVSG